MICPACGSEDIFREEVDVGVGNIYGRPSCNECGWKEKQPSLEEFGFVGPDEEEIPF